MARRITGLVALFAVLLSFMALSAPASANVAAQATAPATVAGISGVVVAAQVRVHSAPNTTSSTLAIIRGNDVLTVTGRNTSGTWVQVLTAAGVSGWSGSAFIKLSSGKFSDLPVVDTTGASDNAQCDTVVKGRVNTKVLTLRSQPDKTSAEIAILRAGTGVIILGTSANNQWLLVTTYDGLTGWVGSPFIFLSAGKLKDIPTVDPASVTTSAPLNAAATDVATSDANAAPTPAATPGGCPNAVATAAAPVGNAVTAKIIVAQLRLRSDPNNTAETLETLKAGDIVTLTGVTASGAWFLAQAPDGIIGWLGAAYVQLTAGKLKDVPVVTGNAPATEVATPAS